MNLRAMLDARRNDEDANKLSGIFLLQRRTRSACISIQHINMYVLRAVREDYMAESFYR